MSMDLVTAMDRAAAVRELYEQLEKHFHGTAWNSQEIMLGFISDVGELSKLVMAAEGRWLHEGNVPEELSGKLAECMWWLLMIARRLNVNLSEAFPAKMDQLEAQLTGSIQKISGTS